MSVVQFAPAPVPVRVQVGTFCLLMLVLVWLGTLQLVSLACGEKLPN